MVVGEEKECPRFDDNLTFRAGRPVYYFHDQFDNWLIIQDGGPERTSNCTYISAIQKEYNDRIEIQVTDIFPDIFSPTRFRIHKLGFNKRSYRHMYWDLQDKYLFAVMKDPLHRQLSTFFQDRTKLFYLNFYPTGEFICLELNAPHWRNRYSSENVSHFLDTVKDKLSHCFQKK
jgi:hypothetical protein